MHDDHQYHPFQSWNAFWDTVHAYPLRHMGRHTRTLFDLLGCGKGLRSQKIYDVALSCGALIPDHAKFAAALEHIHAASLCHDDVLDNGAVRRQSPCIHRMHNSAQAILLGDALVAEGLSILAHLPYPDIVALTCQCLAELVEGQMAEQLIHAHSCQESYLEMIAQKTGSLFGLAYQGAGLISGRSKEQAHVLYQAGCEAGIAYQLHDDCNEYEQTVDQWNAGHDCLQKKWTLPVLHAYQKDAEAIERTLHAVWADPHNTQKKSYLVHALHASINYVRTLAKDYEQQSMRRMAHLFNL